MFFWHPALNGETSTLRCSVQTCFHFGTCFAWPISNLMILSGFFFFHRGLSFGLFSGTHFSFCCCTPPVHFTCCIWPSLQKVFQECKHICNLGVCCYSLAYLRVPAHSNAKNTRLFQLYDLLMRGTMHYLQCFDPIQLGS